MNKVSIARKKAAMLTCGFLLLAIIFAACSKKINHRNFPAAEIIPSANKHILDIMHTGEPVQVAYLGCGHLAIQYQNEVILIDPFFSTQGFTKTKIQTDAAAFKKYKTLLKENGFDLSKTKSVWVAHTHYDHMMDLPIMLSTQAIPNGAAIYGNSFGDDILGNFISGQYHALEPSEVYDPGKNAAGKWFEAAPAVRVLPILSDHAPHYKFLGIPIHLMQGNVDASYFHSTLKEAGSKTKRGRWKEGTTYSYLIDFLDGETIATRIFVQTSGSHFPLGKPPVEELKKRKVDVAFLCTASAAYVKPYPIEILNVLKPQKTVFIHWEDFFRKPLDFDGARFVRFSNFRKLNRTLENGGYDLNPKDYVMPRPGTFLSIE
jgi:hypothetical protein